MPSSMTLSGTGREGQTRGCGGAPGRGGWSLCYLGICLRRCPLAVCENPYATQLSFRQSLCAGVKNSTINPLMQR